MIFNGFKIELHFGNVSDKGFNGKITTNTKFLLMQDSDQIYDTLKHLIMKN